MQGKKTKTKVKDLNTKKNPKGGAGGISTSGGLKGGKITAGDPTES